MKKPVRQLTSPAASHPRAATRRDEVDAVVQGLRRIVKALESYSWDVESSFGLTGPQLWAVKTLERSGPLPVSRLAEELVVHQASASILVTRLEKRGLVSRVRSEQDRRVVRISLTSEGRKIAAQAPEAAQGRLLHGLLAMTQPEVRFIREAIDQLVVAMEAEDLEATFFFAEE
jgi:DNA-binding MarR family transcriptional regulator